MREIKYEAWHEAKKVMLRVGDKFGTTHPLDCVVYARQGQPVKLREYTGRKDCKGKDVYEGDILRQRRRNWTGKGVVVADSGCFWFRRYVGGGQEELYIAITNEECEVIGNIYENPELLEGGVS